MDSPIIVFSGENIGVACNSTTIVHTSSMNDYDLNDPLRHRHALPTRSTKSSNVSQELTVSTNT